MTLQIFGAVTLIVGLGDPIVVDQVFIPTHFTEIIWVKGLSKGTCFFTGGQLARDGEVTITCDPIPGSASRPMQLFPDRLMVSNFECGDYDAVELGPFDCATVSWR